MINLTLVNLTIETHQRDGIRVEGRMTTVAWEADGRLLPGFLYHRCRRSEGDPRSRCFRPFHYLQRQKNICVRYYKYVHMHNYYYILYVVKGIKKSITAAR